MEKFTDLEEFSIKLNIILPIVPQYIKLAGSETVINVTEFNESEIISIASQWVKELLKKSCCKTEIHLLTRTEAKIIDDYLRNRNLCDVCLGPYNCGSDHK